MIESTQPSNRFRCQACGRLLATVGTTNGASVHIKCPHCNAYNTFLIIRPDNHLTNYEKRSTLT